MQKIPQNIKIRGKSKQLAYQLILFLLQPFLLLIISLKNYKAEWAKNSVWLITIFYGLTFAIAPDSTADSVRYAARLEQMYYSDFTLSMLISMFFVPGGYTDIYQPLLTYIVSRFTSDYSVLFGVFGFVLGYFYSRNIWYTIKLTDNKLNQYTVLLIFVFAFIVSISSGINGVRMWTGAHIFVFGLFVYFLDGRKYGVIIALSSILVHFSYVAPAILLLFYLVAGNRLVIYYIIFVFSYFIGQIDFEIGRQIASLFPAYIEDGTSGYIGESREQSFMAQERERVWFMTLNSVAFPLAILLLSSYLFIFKRKFIENVQYLHNLFAFGLLFYGVFNIFGFYPSVGRFLSPAGMILFAVFIGYIANYKISFRKNDNRFLWIILLVSPALLLNLAIAVRVFLGNASYLFFIGNPLFAPFLHSDMGIYEFIRQLI